MNSFDVVVAHEASYGIGKDGQIPWKGYVPDDVAFFRKLTTSTVDPHKKNVVVMGRKTWFSLPKTRRPLPNRLNVVLSRTLKSVNDLMQDCSLEILGTTTYQTPLLFSSFENCVTYFTRLYSTASAYEKMYVIGGEELYTRALKHPACRNVYVTHIKFGWECDAFFPRDLLKQQRFIHCPEVVVQRNTMRVLTDVQLEFHKYTREANAEETYLELLRSMLQEHARNSQRLSRSLVRQDRTGTGTISTFGKYMRIDLRNSFPLLTTKKMFWKGVVEELLWFIRGDTNAQHLADSGVHIWDANGSKEFLRKRGLGHYAQGQLGPVYGFQWRHYGAQYRSCFDSYRGQGIDQLRRVIETLKSNPTDRRMIVTAWNPCDLDKMALPPCHVLFQFYVNDEQELCCALTQRSCDMGLGVPFNIASYSLLTCMVAHVTGLKRGEFVYFMGDTHIYTNHVAALEEQLTRHPLPPPTLSLNNEIKDIDDFTAKDIVLHDYQSHPGIKMMMAL